MLIINIVLILCLFEIVSRIHLMNRYNINPFRVQYIVKEGIYNNLPHNDVLDPDDLNILILGGSVMYSEYGNVEQSLEIILTDSINRGVNIVNFSCPSHTSLDSYKKYNMLSHKEFDYILIYHGINDVFLNNCPKYVYRDNYTHCKWFRRIEIFDEHTEKGFYSTPLVIHLIYEEIMQRMHKHKLLPSDRPPEHWVENGRVIKNKQAFRDNITAIIKDSQQYGSEVILAEFAYYIPDNYNDELFKQKMADYGNHHSPVSIWGAPEYVEEGIKSNNKILRNLSLRYNLPYIYPNYFIPKSGEYFNDICHLTASGCQMLAFEFAEKIIANERTKEDVK